MLTREQRTYLDANPAAARIWAAIVRRDGEPASRAALCRWLRIPDRRLRDTISEPNELAFPIVPIERKPGGYKLGTREECDVAAAVLRAKSGTMDRRARGLERCYQPEPETQPSTPQEALFI